MSDNTSIEIKDTLDNNSVVLFMKGTSSMPQCGFSSKVAGILSYMDIKYKDINVLENENIRQGIKDFSDWPTIPQLYVNGEFVGGCDIIVEMTLSGELDDLLSKQKVSFDKEAANKIREENKYRFLKAKEKILARHRRKCFGCLLDIVLGSVY